MLVHNNFLPKGSSFNTFTLRLLSFFNKLYREELIVCFFDFGGVGVFDTEDFQRLPTFLHKKKLFYFLHKQANRHFFIKN